MTTTEITTVIGLVLILLFIFTNIGGTLGEIKGRSECVDQYNIQVENNET